MILRSSNITRVERFGGRIRKRYRPQKSLSRFHRQYKNPVIAYPREVEVLTQLLDEPHFPTLISTDPSKMELVISDGGDELTDQNAPSDWRAQLREIVVCLDHQRLSHNDMAIHNFVVRDGVISLIDFDKTVSKIDYPFNNLTLDDLARNEPLTELFERKLREALPIRTAYEKSF